MARPQLDIDMDKLAALMRFKPTQADCAAFFKCSEDTIANRIKDETGLSFSEFRSQNMVHTRFSLIRSALKKAEGGDNVMLIFCLKNMCEWRDKQPDETDVVVNNIMSIPDDKLEARVDELVKKHGK